MKRIVFWQDIPSMHQAAFIREVAARLAKDTYWIVEQGTPGSREQLGWSTPEMAEVRLTIQPSEDEIHNVLNQHGHDTIHIFSGYAHPFVRRVLRYALDLPHLNIALMSEANRFQGVAGGINRIRGKWLTRHLRSMNTPVFAIGHLAMEWYRLLGFSEDSLFPFGYFVDRTHGEDEHFSQTPSRPNSVNRFVFVGRHCDLKGGELLLKAFAYLGSSSPWRLDFIGDGPRRAAWQRHANQLGLGERVTFHGVLPNHEVLQRLAEYDCLVLPSQGDGWGAVINETLNAGVKAICSDLSGAAVLLSNPERGEVFQTNSVKSLAWALENQIRLGPLRPEQRQTIRAWSENISPKTAAAYFCEALEYAFADDKTARRPPIAPWLS